MQHYNYWENVYSSVTIVGGLYKHNFTASIITWILDVSEGSSHNVHIFVVKIETKNYKFPKLHSSLTRHFSFVLTGPCVS